MHVLVFYRLLTQLVDEVKKNVIISKHLADPHKTQSSHWWHQMWTNIAHMNMNVSILYEVRVFFHSLWSSSSTDCKAPNYSTCLSHYAEITNSTQKNPPWYADSSCASPEIPRTLRNPTVRYAFPPATITQSTLSYPATLGSILILSAPLCIGRASDSFL